MSTKACALFWLSGSWSVVEFTTAKKQIKVNNINISKILLWYLYKHLKFTMIIIIEKNKKINKLKLKFQNIKLSKQKINNPDGYINTGFKFQ